MTVRTGEFMIYSFYNKETNTYNKEFFTPDDTLKKFMYRQLTIASYKEEGFQIAGVLYVNHETYLNARLTKTVEDYLYNDQYEQEVKKKFKRGEMSRDVYLDTIKCIQDNKWTDLKILDSQIRRLIRNDYDVENEIAIQLYDEYLRHIM